MQSRVLLHCSMGQVRAPTLAALLLVRRGRTPTEAVAFVRRRRPISDPDEGVLRVLHKYQLKKRKEEEAQTAKIDAEPKVLHISKVFILRFSTLPRERCAWIARQYPWLKLMPCFLATV